MIVAVPLVIVFSRVCRDSERLHSFDHYPSFREMNFKMTIKQIIQYDLCSFIHADESRIADLRDLSFV